MAARRENRSIDFDALVTFSRDAVAGAKDLLLIEGIGGVMVPLNETHTVLDWMAALNIPLVLVAGSYLGSLSHTLTCLDVLARRGLAVKAVVVNETPGSAVTRRRHGRNDFEFFRHDSGHQNAANADICPPERSTGSPSGWKPSPAGISR